MNINLDEVRECNVGPNQLRIPLDYDPNVATITLVRKCGQTRTELPASGVLEDGQHYLECSQNWDSGLYQVQGIVTLGSVFLSHTPIYRLRIK